MSGCLPILAAIEGKHLKAIEWLMVKGPLFCAMPDVVFAAAATDDDVLATVMQHVTIDAIGTAFFQAGAHVDQPGVTVERLLRYLEAHPITRASVYICAMDAAATYKYWQFIEAFLRVETLKQFRYEELGVFDIDRLRSAESRAASHDMNSPVTKGLRALLDRGNGHSDGDSGLQVF